ncbi:MAG: ferrochelatase [Cytophagales bacterium]|nr:ferrochelatase [Cytophagales bacterium]
MATTAVLLANLGSPDSYQVKDLRKYLNEFLMDERVIDIPYFFRALLVKGIIVPFRSPKSAHKYKTVWTENGSPLIHISKQVQKALNQKIDLPVELSMRYGNPTPDVAFENLLKQNPDLKEVVLVPLYPHYAMSSYETAMVQVQSVHDKMRYSFSLRVVPPFYNHSKYIQALANSIKPYLEKPFDRLLFSYHGIPERHVRKSDPTKVHCLMKENCCTVASEAHSTCYRHQVLTTTELVAKALGSPPDKFSSSFQSRLGADAWLKPNSADHFMQFPKQGIKKLVVACPAFVSDCLETLEEIQMEGKETFMENGGDEYTVIPCLNQRSEWIETLAELVRENISKPQA